MASSNRFFPVVILPIFAAILVAGAEYAIAGDLNPPAGPVAPTHKTLTEVEPRTAVNDTNTPGDADSIFRITQSGSYYLTGNVTGLVAEHGIQIEANGVTLDLNGFTLLGVAGSLDGINMPAFRENVVIRNGHVRGWGESGVESRIDLGRIEQVTAGDNGAWGIDNAASGTFTTHISSCESRSNGLLVAATGGIRTGQAAIIRDCIAQGNTGNGIVLGVGAVVSVCLAVGNSGDGIVASNACTISGCTAYLNTGDGIRVPSDCLVVGNTCDSNGTGDGAGIHAANSDNRIEGNNCTDADRGIDVDGTGNIIIRNTCSGNTTNWDIVIGNAVAPIVQASTNAAAISGNTYAGSLGSTDPNANFTY